MKRTLFFAVLFVLIANTVLAYQIFPIWFHVHSNKSLTNGCSDGQYDIDNLIKIALTKKGYSGIVITDHADMILGKPNCVKNYFNYINQFNKEGYFVSIAGQEITVALNPEKPEGGNAKNCHLNFLSSADNLQAYSLEYPSIEVDKAIGFLKDVDSDSFIVYNHPRDCKLWEDKFSLFDGIELFNDFEAKVNIKENYRYQRWVYLRALHQGKHIAVIGGSDFHNEVQWKFGWVATYVFADKLSQSDVMDAFRDARTIATRDAKVLNFSPVPSRKYYVTNKDAEIQGAVSLPLKESNLSKMLVYRDGEFYQSFQIKGEAYGWGREKYSFSFSDSSFYQGEKHCYVLEIEQYMITSPICFERGNETSTDTLKEGALRITEAYYNSDGNIEIKTENDALYHSFRFYEICPKGNLIKSPRGIVSACKNPSFVIHRITVVEEKTLFAQGSCGTSTGINFNFDQDKAKKACIKELENSYILKIGGNDYRAVESGYFSHEFIMITDNPFVSEDEVFITCNLYSQSYIDKITFDEQGKIIGCVERDMASASKKDPNQFFYNLTFNTLIVLGSDYFILLKK